MFSIRYLAEDTSPRYPSAPRQISPHLDWSIWGTRSFSVSPILARIKLMFLAEPSPSTLRRRLMHSARVRVPVRMSSSIYLDSADLTIESTYGLTYLGKGMIKSSRKAGTFSWENMGLALVRIWSTVLESRWELSSRISRDVVSMAWKLSSALALPKLLDTSCIISLKRGMFSGLGW